MGLQQTLDTRRQRARNTRRIIEKVHDLHHGRKLDRLYAVRAEDGDGGEPALVACLASLREYMECAFREARQEDVRVEALLSQFLVELDRLTEAVRSAWRRDSRIARGFVASALRHHGDLFGVVYGERIELEHCPDRWEATRRLAEKVWGSGL